MGILKKIFGISDTKQPANPDSWNYTEQLISIDLDRTPELAISGGAVRLEGNGLPHRIFVIRDENNTFHAFENRCTHMGRRLNPGDNPGSIKCCSVSGSVFDFSGNPVGGAAKRSIKTFPIQHTDNHLEINLG